MLEKGFTVKCHLLIQPVLYKKPFQQKSNGQNTLQLTVCHTQYAPVWYTVMYRLYLLKQMLRRLVLLTFTVETLQ